MITLEQIEEWIHEVEQRPSSAALIIQYIGKRLLDLTGRNEELLSENIELRTGRRIEEYEKRIANLEYQLDILKRQVGQAGGGLPSVGTASSAANLILYNREGKVIRVEIPTNRLKAGQVIVTIPQDDIGGAGLPRLLVAGPQDELLFVFDSGRTETCPVFDLPVCREDHVDWQQSRLVEPRGSEELSVVFPVSRMALFDYCVQVSRRGCAKRMMKTSFESHVTNSFIGAGVKAKPDRTCCLVFAGKGDRLVLASREGFLANLAIDDLPYTIEEVIRIAVTDHILTAFRLEEKQVMIMITNNGKVLQRETGWLPPVESFRSKGTAVFSQSRREAGIRAAGVACAAENDWAVLFISDGRILTYRIAQLAGAGVVPDLLDQAAVLDFATIAMPETSQ